MSTTLCVFLLTLSTLCGSRVVSGVLGPPTNVRFISHNMDLVLLWDPPEGAPDDVLYTVEYMTAVAGYTEVCVNISAHECDFCNNSVELYEHAIYTGRVRAQAMNETSTWTETEKTPLDDITVIGAPDVSLFSSGTAIELSINDPVFIVSELRTMFITATYNITYWKEGKKEKAVTKSHIQQNRVVLSDLDPWTKYCVQVQVDTNRDNNFSEPSTAICENTTNNEEPPWVAALVTFVAMAMMVSLVVVAVMYRKSISHFFCPKDTLPQHFKEYLLEPPNSPIYLAMRNSKPPQEIYDQVSIIPDSRNMEEGRPLEVVGSNCSRQHPDVAAGDR